MDNQKNIAQYATGDTVVLRDASVLYHPLQPRLIIEGYDAEDRIIQIDVDSLSFTELALKIGDKAKVEINPLTLRIKGSTQINLSY